ncbi:MAG: hypothetical protein DCC51_09480 [Anaerolineae bacterium]|nr:MAG: hypothetical protein DCC51_09480 [Anaerolineae bacterium]
MHVEDEWTPPHIHEPNPAPPSDDPAFQLLSGTQQIYLSPADLATFPQVEAGDCYIISTGHGTSGPFKFGGVSLRFLIDHYFGTGWKLVDIFSADGFRTRLTAAELKRVKSRPVLLALAIDGRALTREKGLVRLIVPHETDDALRQVKWVSEIRVYR